MKKLQNFFGMLLLLMVALVPVTDVRAYEIINLVGDKDNIGTDIPYATGVTRADWNAFAHRDPGDGDTDMDTCLWCKQNLFSWQHDFDLPAGSVIRSATLTIATFDLEDGGAADGRGAGPADTLLFLNGIEVPKAFDDTYTPDGFPIRSQLTDFNLSPEFLGLLKGGALNVLMNSNGGTWWDCIAIDYAELKIVYDNNPGTPEPATMFLLGIGIIGLAGLKKRFYNRSI